MMNLFMKMMVGMMGLIPRIITSRVGAPMISKKRRAFASENSTSVPLTFENMLICTGYCGSCPSNPGKMEPLYCATGPSAAEVVENGCNCITCPLFDLCGNSAGYFCRDGVCNGGMSDGQSQATDPYLDRFIQVIEQPVSPDPMHREEIWKNTPSVGVSLDFEGDKIVETDSHTTILQASLESGIDHFHVCGGNARCSTCRVVVTGGAENCETRNEIETDLARIKGFSSDIRLACQTRSHGNLQLRRLVFDRDDLTAAISEGRGNSGVAGAEIKAAILFSDIRSFTSFSEKNLPYDIIHLLNRYFNSIGDVIDANGGYIDKYMGDGIMVVFGLEKDVEGNPAWLALNTARQMVERLAGFNQYLDSHFHHTFKIGIGIHYGTVIVGNLGYRKKMEFTAIGDTVNTASRIESLNKKAGSTILVSSDARKKIDRYLKSAGKASAGVWKRKITAKVKGKSDTIVVYEPGH